MRKLQSSLPRFLTHRVCSKVLAGLIGVVAVGPASAGEDIYRPKLTLQVTLPAVYNNNFGLARRDEVDGVNATPGGKLTLEGKLSTNLTYIFTNSTSLDRYDKTGFASDEALTNFLLLYKWSGWEFRGSYQSKWVFDPTFAHLQIRLDDFVFGIDTPPIALGRAGSLAPYFRYRERSATDVVSSNHSPLLGLTWSKEFDGSLKGWTAEVDFGVRYLEYDRRPIVARDWVIGQEFNLYHELATNVKLKLSATHENRQSNILERDYDVWTAGGALILTANIF